MNRLECQVSSCSYHCDGLCCLSGIRVDGPAARESGQTCCGSYEERKPGHNAGQNSAVHGCTPTEESIIDCSAEHCMYNDGCKCYAEHVCVGCSCGDACSKSGTECCTFRPE